MVKNMKLKRQTGMTLIELMVALAIGAFLMIGAITVFMQSRTTFRITESLSRLQENARFALDAIEPDIRMAHYWGLTPRTYLIVGYSAANAGALRRTPANPAAPGLVHPCGNNWAVNLNQAVQATNNSYTWGCAGLAPVETNSDALVIRRVTEDPVAAAAGQVSIQSTRSQLGQIFVGAAVPAGFNATTSATHRLIVNGYYVSRTSTVAGVPSLRRKILRANGAGLVDDEEVIAGVEDMQIQFGVDTDIPGTSTVPNPNRGSIDRYLNPNDPMIDPTNAAYDPNTEILSVRIWLRVRAERTEPGFTDTTNYIYADQNVGPFNDGFRRLLLSKTIYLRNARPAS
jgi:type IV pilus assembly protein PilW